MSKKFENNVVVSRRLALITAAQGKSLAPKFVKGEIDVSTVAEKCDTSHTKAAYAIRQYAVELGLVKTMVLELDAKKISAAHGNGDHSDWAWLACRSGRTPQSLQNAVNAVAQTAPRAKKTAQASTARRGGNKKAEKATPATA